MKDREAWDKHNRLHRQYLNLIYNPYEKCYYRMVLLPMDEVEYDRYKSKSRQSSSKISIIKLNQYFQIETEALLGREKYSPDVFFVTEDGLFISTSNPYNPDINEDEIVFEKISFGG